MVYIGWLVRLRRERYAAMGRPPYQQQLGGFEIAVVIVRAKRNRIEELEPLVPKILDARSTAAKGKPTWVAAMTMGCS